MSGVARTVGVVAGVAASAALFVGAVATGNPALAAVAAKVAAIASVASPPADIGAAIQEKPMPAINLCADHRRAYLATDSGYFDPSTGRIVALGGKALVLPDVQMAIGISGSGSPAELMQNLNTTCEHGTQRAILAALPNAIACMAVERKALNPTGWSTVRLWIASYDRVRAKPRLFTVASDPDPSSPHIPPLVVNGVRGWATGLTPVQVATLLPAGYVANPRADLTRMFEAQRGYAFPHMGGRCGVAGDCDLYTVSRRGVTVETLIRFPEGVGAVPNPAAPGEVVARG